MIFCETCRVKNKWPRLPGFPVIGFKQNGPCELCHSRVDCHDVPGGRLIPEKDKTQTQKTVDKIMNEGYKEKAETLMVTYVSGREAGKLNPRLTDLLRTAIIRDPKTMDVDWYSTFLLRQALQRGYQMSEESKRDRRSYVL